LMRTIGDEPSLATAASDNLQQRITGNLPASVRVSSCLK
jgi:hypothetical protein